MPNETRAYLEQKAQENCRSLNDELLYRINQSIQRDNRVRDLLDELLRISKELKRK